MRQVLLAVLTAAALMTAGCAGSDDTSDDTASETSTPTGGGGQTTTGSSGTTTMTTTSPPPQEDNEPPTATLTADVSEGSVPLEVTFTLDGDDPDGDALDWSLDLDGAAAMEEGSGLPATVVATFDAVGEYTVNLTVSDGEAEASDSLVITTVEAPPTTCGGLGRIFSEDAQDDSSAGVGEATCLGAGYDGTTFTYYVHVVDPTAMHDGSSLFFDFYFTPSFGEMADEEQLIDAAWDGESVDAFWDLGTSAGLSEATFVENPAKEVSAAWEGNVLKVSFDVSNFFDPVEEGSPADGDTLSGVYVDINHCEGTASCEEIVGDDRVPDADGVQIVFSGDSVTS